MSGNYGPFEAMLGFRSEGASEFRGLFGPGTWFLLRFLNLLGRPPLRFLVAAQEGRIVGTTLIVPWERSGYVLGVGVRPSHRRQGLAGRLVAWAEELALQRGKEWAVLDVEEDNLPAVTLYLARQYGTIQKTLWFRCAPPAGQAGADPPSAQVEVVGKAGRKGAALWCARQVPATVTSVLPPSAARLSHLESLGQFPGVTRETWAAGPHDARVGYLAAYWRGKERPGVLFLPALGAQATRADVLRLVQEGVAWLRSRGSPEVLLAVPDPARSALPFLAEQGFSPQLTTLTMARRLRGAGSPAPAPKRP
ncbi:MAG: GNAT family N-acetyltransferase [Thermoplasmata archaeon]|nr:GNAT family N-acetyltransferase [Thermoplasmata archaeon]